MKYAVVVLCLFALPVPFVKASERNDVFSDLSPGSNLLASGYDPYGYNYSRYPRFPFTDPPPRRPSPSVRERYVTILVPVDEYGWVFDRSTGSWRQSVVSRRYVKRTIRCEWNAQYGCYGYFQDGRFVPVRE